jgi:hypothetical protein
MLIFIFVAVTLVPITAQAWTAELTDSNSGSRECQDLPYTDEAGDIIKTPDDFITEVETTDPNPMVDHDSGEITITYHNDQNGVSQMVFFGTHRACQQYVDDENQNGL